MNEMTIIPAGAGSGKTYRIKTDLTRWVRDKLVAPERIMAVTFSDAAASELRDRIRASLLQEGLVEEAMAVERAYISTIHALGLRLMTEHALAAGSSPSPRQLSDAERELLLRIELARCEELDVLKSDLPRYGYTASYGGHSIEDSFRGTILKAIDVLQGLGEGASNPALGSAAVAELQATYGPVLADGEPLMAALQVAAKALIDAYPQGGKGLGNSKAAEDDFDKQHAALIDALRDDELSRNWKLWTTLAGLRTSGKRLVLPSEFVALSEAVKAAAARVNEHPGPLEDACTNLRCVVEGAQRVMSRYSQAKRRAGVIDFADMITDAERLLREQDAVLDALLAEVDCVIIDEFQDTNPVQFALLWRIAKRAKRTLIVGDTKQSIMGFQGADPRLTAELEMQFERHIDPLVSNWRSDPRIMGLVNAISGELFGDRYIPLAAQRQPTGETAIEALLISETRQSRKSKPHHHVAARIKRMLDEGETFVIDRHSGVRRPAKAGDIAVLCRTNPQAARYADALRALSVPVRITQNGWLDSPVIQASRAALAYAADPDDRYSALLFLTLGPPAMGLETAMKALTEGQLADLPELAELTALSARAPDLPLASLLGELLDVSGIRSWALRLPDARQMRANLLRLEAEALNFADAHRDMKAAAGFFGETAPVFLGWLEAQRNDRNFDRQPDPEAGGATGVEITTWHSSKGREWNIVVVTGLDTKVEDKPGNVWAEFSSFDDLDQVLASAALKFMPQLPIPEKQVLFTRKRQAAVNEDAKRLVYVALTRARDRLVLEWPQFQFKAKPKPDAEPSASYARLMVEEAGFALTGDGLVVAGQAFEARLTACGADLPPEFDDPGAAAPTRNHKFGDPRPTAHAPLTPWVRNPSQIASSTPPAAAAMLIVDLGGPVGGTAMVATATERGTAWHLAYRVALSAPDRINKVAAATGLDVEVLMSIRAQAGQLRDWLTANGYNDLLTEVPIQAANPDGSSTSGVIDCLAMGPAGGIIIDHKSGPADDLAASVSRYASQLQAYHEMVTRLFPNVHPWSTAINFINPGRLCVIRP